MKQVIVKRIKEPSTWTGLAAVVAGFSFLPHAGDIAGLLPSLGVVIAGIIGIVLPEGSA